jgi:thioester reductase-like protein
MPSFEYDRDEFLGPIGGLSHFKGETIPDLFYDGTYASLFRKNALDFPDYPFATFSAVNTTYTYSQLLHSATCFGAGLVQLGIPAGACIAVALPNSIDALTAQCSVLSSGYSGIWVNPAYGLDELTHSVSDVDAAAIVLPAAYAGTDKRPTLRQLAAALPNLTIIVSGLPSSSDPSVDPLDVALTPFCDVSLDPATSDAQFAALEAQAAAVTPDDTCLMSYTSGSTGTPKAVVHTHATVVNAALQMRTFRGFAPGPESQVHLSPTPMFFTAASIMTTHCAALSARHLVITPLPFNVAHVIQAIDRYQINFLVGVPATYLALFAHPDWAAVRDSPNFKPVQATVSAAPVSVELLNAMRREFGDCCRVSAGFGMTETGCLVTQARFDKMDLSELPGSAGMVCPNCEVRLCAEAAPTTPVPVGHKGEVQVRLPMLFKRYYRRPDLTAECFTDDGWFRTGDVGVFRPSGVLSIVGRLKDMIIRGGVNVFPPEIEAYIDRACRMPPLSVASSAVVGTAHPALGEVPVAFVVRSPGAPPINPTELEDGVIAALAESDLADFKRPTRVFPLQAFPRTGTGKISKPLLRKQLKDVLEAERLSSLHAAANAGDAPAYVPNTDAYAIATVFATALATKDPATGKETPLPLAAIAPDASFFGRLGGSSISASVAVLGLRDAFPDVPEAVFGFESFYATPTVAGVAARVAKAKAAAVAPAAENAGARVPNLPSPEEMKQFVDAAALPTNLLARIRALAPAPTGDAATKQDVLLTGATGFLGVFLLHDLLGRPDVATVHCVVRGSATQSPAQRLKARCERAGVPLSAADCRRVVCHDGDVSRPQLGLSDACYRAVVTDATQLGTVVHNAAVVHWTRPFAEMAAANVDAALYALEAAVNSPTTVARRLVFVSTISTAPTMADYAPNAAPVPARLRPLSPATVPYPRFGYATTKFAAEALLLSAIETNPTALAGRVSVLRPGFISSLSTPPHSANTDDYIARVVSACVSARCCPDWDDTTAADLVPVDAVAKAIIDASYLRATPANVANIVPPSPLPWRRVFEALRAAGFELPVRPYADWRAAIAAQGPANALYPLLAMFGRDSWVGKRGLRYEAGINLPSVNSTVDGFVAGEPTATDAYLASWIRSLISVGFLPAPEGSTVIVDASRRISRDSAAATAF